MALYDQLPVYKISYDLLLQLYHISKNMERDYKFTLGEKIKNESTELIIHIYKANTNMLGLCPAVVTSDYTGAVLRALMVIELTTCPSLAPL
jgi:hypothetical protein